MIRVLLLLISCHLEFIINYQRFIYLQFIVKKNYTFFESIYACHLSLVLRNDLKIQKPPVVTLEARQSLRCVAQGGASRWPRTALPASASLRFSRRGCLIGRGRRKVATLKPPSGRNTEDQTPECGADIPQRHISHGHQKRDQ